jgi:hypothetical protein
MSQFITSDNAITLPPSSDEASMTLSLSLSSLSCATVESGEKGDSAVIVCPAATSPALLGLRLPLGRGRWIGVTELPSGVHTSSRLARVRVWVSYH